MSTDTDEYGSGRRGYLVAYDPHFNTTVEIWSDEGTLFAELPSGNVVTGDEANEILKAVEQADHIPVVEVAQ